MEAASQYFGSGVTVLLGKLYQLIIDRPLRNFWVSSPSDKIYILYGLWSQPLLEELRKVGEIENVANQRDAMAQGELRVFLSKYYKEVLVREAEDPVDSWVWQYPVVLLGGIDLNPATRVIVTRYKDQLKAWFKRDVPGGRNKIFDFEPKMDANGNLEEDIGCIARIRGPSNKFVYLIVGAYGAGTLGASRFLQNSANVKVLDLTTDPDRVFHITKTTVFENQIHETQKIL